MRRLRRAGGADVAPICRSGWRAPVGFGQAATVSDDAEIFRQMPFPFDDDTFPTNLGAVVQRTILDGTEPAREVTHVADGSWLVGDGVNDPNAPGAVVVTHISHVVERNSSVADLATLPFGHVARRTQNGVWVREPHVWLDDE